LGFPIENARSGGEGPIAAAVEVEILNSSPYIFRLKVASFRKRKEVQQLTIDPVVALRYE